MTSQSNLQPSGYSPITVTSEDISEEPELITSSLSDESSVESAQLLELSGSEGSLIFYPKVRDFEVGDVLYLREKDHASQEQKTTTSENGVIVQIISKGIANYPQADSKALFRLLTTARYQEIKQRSYNEPREIIDEFLIGEFFVRASIQNGEWKEPEGKVVTRNVDIFPISPRILSQNIIANEDGLNLFLGNYKEQSLEVYAGGFEKVNLITGMKGGGKSHITKGIIHLQRNLGMSSVVFDINGEYGALPNSQIITPTRNLKFRLDQLPLASLFKVFDKLSLFNTAATENSVKANLGSVLEARKQVSRIPDLEFLANRTTAEEIVTDNNYMIEAYQRGINNLRSYNIFCTEQEARQDDQALKKGTKTAVISLRTLLYRSAYSENALENADGVKPQTLDDLKENSSIFVFNIGGLPPIIQEIIVALVIDRLKEACNVQYQRHQDDIIDIPVYPSVFFEEAHMYMDDKYIDELIPLIRHLGMNLFFITNTPSALPDSVFRLVDNAIMTRMVNKKDIDKVVGCGLADKKTIEGFARDLPKYHNLFLSANNGATKNFPLVFKVRDFTASPKDGGEGLPKSGVTRSMWEVIKQKNS